MLNRDFTKSNKHYFNKNKIALICVAVFLLVGIIITAIFGMNGNFEFKGYNEFSVKVGYNADYSKCQKELTQIVNAEGGKVDTISIAGEGDNTKLVVRYMKDLSTEIEAKISSEVAEKLDVDALDISNHVHVSPTVKATDYVYTASAILIIVVGATLFAYFRYNGASALTIIISCALGTLGYMCLGSILRLTIGMSYFAMLAILNVLIVYLETAVFEVVREESWLATNDYESALKSAVDKTKFRTLFVTIAVFAIGLLFALIAPNAIKYVSLNIMFLAVTLIAVIWYVLPFVWSVFITKTKYKAPKKKETKKEIKDIEE